MGVGLGGSTQLDGLAGRYDVAQLFDLAAQAQAAVEVAALAEVVAEMYASLPFPSPIGDLPAADLAGGTPLGVSPFAVQAGMDPRAALLLAGGGQNVDDWLTPEQVLQNIAATFQNPAYADLSLRPRRLRVRASDGRGKAQGTLRGRVVSEGGRRRRPLIRWRFRTIPLTSLT